jgi:nitrous oxidase accessory protein NosD
MHKVYGRGAAGIVFNRARRAYVSNVTISTPSNGILVRHSPQTVISNTTIYAPPNTQNTSRAVSAVASPQTVVQNSNLWGGFHSLMAIDMRGIVVRNIHAEGATTGFHSVYAGRALVTNSTFRDMFKAIMSALESYTNAAVGNDVRNTVVGIDFAGSRSYVAQNTLVHNRMGLYIERRATLYTDNVIGYNYAGVTVGDAFPTNRVNGNDFVGNDRHAWVQNKNVLFVWGESGHGNYWAGMPGLDTDGDGYLERDVVPTSPTGRLSYRTSGGDTISRAPAVALLRSLQTAVPGLRSDGIIDRAPLAAPNQPRVVSRLRENYSAAGPYQPAGDKDPYDYHAPYDIPHSENDTFG